jgi:hypothetical protein
MSIINQLSSQTDDRTEYSNRKVVTQCLDHPGLLVDIAGGLTHSNVAIVGDCVEVMAKVAECHPEWVAPFSPVISQLLNHPNTRVRWEAMHALALVASHIPATIALLLPQLAETLRTDHSVIVRDHATDALASYASTGESAAWDVFPLLKAMLTLWDGKQAGHALLGMVNVARQVPTLHSELQGIAEEYISHHRPVVSKSARILRKALG